MFCTLNITLRSGRDCGDLFRLPFGSNSVSNTMEGSIPDCIFQLPELQVSGVIFVFIDLLTVVQTLNAAGNGFEGNIITALPLKSWLRNLTLAHNRLIGKILPLQ